MMREVTTVNHGPDGRVRELSMVCGHSKALSSEAVDRLTEQAMKDRAPLTTDCKLCEARFALTDLMDSGPKMLLADAELMIVWLAEFFYNCHTEVSFAETIKGHEHRILADYMAAKSPWDSSAAIQEENDD